VIPYSTQWIDEDDINAVISVLKSDRLTQGPYVEEFEQGVANYVGVKFAVAFSSGTAALHAACAASGLKSGDEIITSPLTYVASANCALAVGAIPIFADIDPESLTLDWREVSPKITARTRVILPVDFAGHPCDMEEIKALAVQRRLIVIEDAAHALGASYKGSLVGNLADMTILSFHPVKHITTGEGGMVLTNDSGFCEKLRMFRNQGITRDRSKFMNKDEGDWYYEMQELGCNYRITDIQCALGISQVKKIDFFIKRRREIAVKYDEAFSTLPGITILKEKKDSRASYHLYILQLPIENLRGGRRAVFDALVARNLGVNVHYIPVHFHPYYHRRFGLKRGSFPVTEGYYERAISLPLYPKMTDKEVQYVMTSVRDVLEQHMT